VNRQASLHHRQDTPAWKGILQEDQEGLPDAKVAVAHGDLTGSGVRSAAAKCILGDGATAHRACGFVGAGLITVDELRRGAIDHALVLAYPHIRSRYDTPLGEHGPSDDRRKHVRTRGSGGARVSAIQR